MVLTCSICNQKITILQRFNMVEIGDQCSHMQCWNTLIVDKFNLILTNQGVIMDSNTLILDQLTEIPKNQEALAEFGDLNLKEARNCRGLLELLETTVMQKDDAKFLSLFDPFLIEYLDKVAGVSPEELVTQITNVETKRIINNIIKERKKK